MVLHARPGPLAVHGFRDAGRVAGAELRLTRTPDLEVRLLDFGLANTRESASITRTGSQLGSVPYMAPEQVEGLVDAIDERTDVYALGVTLYELLTLQSPFLREGESEAGTRRRILDGDVAPVRSLYPAAPWDAETVCAVTSHPGYWLGISMNFTSGKAPPAENFYSRRREARN